MQDWPEGTQKFVFDTIDSTMAEAKRQAPAIAGAAWFLSYEQTAGTGRRGRAWDSQKGNFAASLLIRPNAPPDQLALRSFLVALTGRKDIFTLKWPNDVLLRGGKLAGILLETHSERAVHPSLIIGIGVNLQNMPAKAKLETTATAPKSLKQETGLSFDPAVFLETLAPYFNHWEQQLVTYGFAPIRQAWLAKAANLGQTITARMPNSETSGVFKTIDDTGALILQTPDGPQVITAAEISF